MIVPSKRIPMPWDRKLANGPVNRRAASAMAETMHTMALIVPAIIPGTKSDIMVSLFIAVLSQDQKTAI